MTNPRTPLPLHSTSSQSHHSHIPVSPQHPHSPFRALEVPFRRPHSPNPAGRTRPLTGAPASGDTSQTPRRACLPHTHPTAGMYVPCCDRATALAHATASDGGCWAVHPAVAGFPQGGPPGSGDDVPNHRSHRGPSKPSGGAPSSIQPATELSANMALPRSGIRDPPSRPLPSPDRSSPRGPCDTGTIGRPPTPIHTQPGSSEWLYNRALTSEAVACTLHTSLRNLACRAQDPSRRASRAVLRATTTTRGIRSQTTICLPRNVTRA